ncbi:MAG: 2,3-dihydro-2,3-dihydroxybenzoate synthetase [Sphingopyxis macrogoltabida]|uniref:2,3-dihydro-2,3-dihydroxybenzoate synthetase n=1 Tax=Sphingopyxis macrogoltabida TaxID=33050 RepID=A0A2W5L0E4_SPHMC|nr:MAG: 2,3-dihydro-2,3-dihydroxybenzoate synthetase [Sphingopyxis macrogoltabida]
MSAPRRLPSIAGYTLPGEAELPASRPDWSLDRDRAALLVHDMQNYFVDAFTPGVEPIVTITAHIAQLVGGARAAGVPVFYTAQNGDQDRRDRGLQADLWGPGMREAPEHQPIVAALEPAAGDHVLVKHRYSAFQRSNLEVLMRARGRDQLIICGIYAHIGCLFTAAEAFQRDIEPFFVADALGDFSRAWHDAALAQAADCCAVVLSARQVLERLA